MKTIYVLLIALAGLVSGCAVYEGPYRDDGVRSADRDRDRDRDRDGVPNRVDRDRDGDGIPNRQDRRPDDPRRY